MNCKIYVMRDQVSGKYGGVFDFANDDECIRTFRNYATSGQWPDYILRDTVVVQLAEVDYSGTAPVVFPLMPTIVLYGSELIRDA